MNYYLLGVVLAIIVWIIFYLIIKSEHKKQDELHEKMHVIDGKYEMYEKQMRKMKKEKGMKK